MSATCRVTTRLMTSFLIETSSRVGDLSARYVGHVFDMSYHLSFGAFRRHDIRQHCQLNLPLLVIYEECHVVVIFNHHVIGHTVHSGGLALLLRQQNALYFPPLAQNGILLIPSHQHQLLVLCDGFDNQAANTTQGYWSEHHPRCQYCSPIPQLISRTTRKGTMLQYSVPARHR